jgi:hypothetical protein
MTQEQETRRRGGGAGPESLGGGAERSGNQTQQKQHRAPGGQSIAPPDGDDGAWFAAQYVPAPPVAPAGSAPDISADRALLAAADSRDLTLLTRGGKRRALLVGAHLVNEVLRAMDLGPPLAPDDVYHTINLDDDLDQQFAEAARGQE